MENKRYYNFTLVIYEDDENFDNQSFNLAQEKEVIYCRHDKDVDEDGNLKKPHYHYVLKLKNACTISALAKRVGVAENMIEPVKKSLNGCLKYLIHFNNDDKYQYDISDVLSNSDKLLKRFQDLVSEDISETVKVDSIESFIDQCNDYVDIQILGKHARKINMWDAFRRNYMYFRDIVNNHNARISAQKYNLDNPYFDSEFCPSLHNTSNMR